MKKTENNLRCIICGNHMRPNLVENTLSRFYPVYICSKCGELEAMIGKFWELNLDQFNKYQVDIKDEFYQYIEKLNK